MPSLVAGVIGLGVGEAHIAGYQTHSACRVKTICDISGQKLAEVRRKYPHLKTAQNADEVLNDPEINVVSIASYDSFHYEQIVKAIEHGKHIFVEKPMCLDRGEAGCIRSLLKKNPQVNIASNLILRRFPRFRKLKELVQKGIFGELFYVEGDYLYGRLHKITHGWRGESDFYSVVYGGGIHMVDLLLWLTSGEVEEVFAQGNQIASRGTRFRFDDFVVAILKFKNGMLGKVSANFGCVFPHFHSIELYGTKASFVHSREGGKLYPSTDPEEKPVQISESYPGAQKGDLIFNFVDSIVNGAAPEITQDDLFRTMSVCFAIEQSAQENQPVQVNYL